MRLTVAGTRPEFLHSLAEGDALALMTAAHVYADGAVAGVDWGRAFAAVT